MTDLAPPADLHDAKRLASTGAIACAACGSRAPKSVVWDDGSPRFTALCSCGHSWRFGVALCDRTPAPAPEVTHAAYQETNRPARAKGAKRPKVAVLALRAPRRARRRRR